MLTSYKTPDAPWHQSQLIDCLINSLNCKTCTQKNEEPFFLWRQSQLLEGTLFEFCEVCRRIAAEAGAQDPGVEALFQAGSGFAPFDRIDRRQVLGADWGEAGQRRGEDADGAAHDQAW